MKAAAATFSDYGLEGMPAICTQDDTSTVQQLDAFLRKLLDSPTYQIIVDGFLTPFVCDSKGALLVVNHFRECKEAGIANYVYVWTLVPCLEHAPYFPVYMVATNNRFDSQFVWDWWVFIVQEALACGINLVGFLSDGDSRLRRTDYQLMYHMRDPNRITIDHPLMYLSIGHICGVPLFGMQDYFHVLMRVRRQLLDPNRPMALGRLGQVQASHLTFRLDVPTADGGLLKEDLRYSDKQNWSGVTRIFGQQTEQALLQKADSDQTYSATYMYVMFGFRLLRMMTGDCAPLEGKTPEELKVLQEQAVADAAWCLHFVIYWSNLLEVLA